MILAKLIVKMDNNQAIDTKEHLYNQEGIILINGLENISSDYASNIKVSFIELENKRLSNG